MTYYVLCIIVVVSFLFAFCQRFLDNPRADSSQILHAGVLWFRMCHLPFWGLADPGGRKKGEIKFSLLWESMGNFCIFAVFERYLSNAWTDPHEMLYVQGQCLPTCPFPLWHLGSVGPWGQVEGELKIQKMGGGLIRAIDSCYFYFSQGFQMWFNMQSRDLRTFWCRSVKIGQGDSTGQAKKFEKISNFSPFRDFTSIYLRNY